MTGSRRRRGPAAACGLGVALLLMPALASAHGGFGRGTPFYDGLLHVLLNVPLVLPLVAVALFVSQHGRGLMRRAQLALGGGVALGGAIALAAVALGVDLSGVAVVNRALVVVAGVLVAWAPRVGCRAVLALVGIAGLLCGLELLSTDTPESAVFFFTLGSVFGALIVQGLVAVLALLARAEWARVGVRVAGSWVAAVGLIYAGFALA